MAGRVSAAYETFKWTVSEASETATTIFEVLDSMYTAVSSVASPGQLLLYTVAACVLLWAAAEILREGGADSPASSAEGSPASSPPESPRFVPAAPQVMELPPEVARSLSQQAAALGEIM
eukprot:976549-Alexandrium_andersonii.AAC.1